MQMWWLLVSSLLTLFPCNGASDTADCETLKPFPVLDADCVVAASVRGKSGEPGGSIYVVSVQEVAGTCDLRSEVPTECWVEDGAALLVNASAHLAPPCNLFVEGEFYLLSLSIEGYSCPALAWHDGYGATLRLGGVASEELVTSRFRIVRQEEQLIREYLAIMYVYIPYIVTPCATNIACGGGGRDHVTVTFTLQQLLQTSVLVFFLLTLQVTSHLR